MTHALSNKLYFSRASISVAIVVTGLIMIANIIWTLDKGLIFHDESWELLNYQAGAHTIDYSNWHRVLHFLYTDNLFHLRLITFGIISSSAFLLGLAANRLLELPYPAWVIGILMIIFQFFLNSPVKLVPSYTNMNLVSINMSVAAFIFFHIEKRKSLRVLALVICSFFISILPFVLVTNVTVIGALFILLMVITERGKRWRYALVFTTSVLIYPAIYFVSIESPVLFWEKYREATLYLSMDADYGLFGLLKWHAKLMLHFIQFPAAVLLLAFLLEKKLNPYLQFLLKGVVILLIALQLYKDSTFQFSQFPVTLWYVLLLALLWQQRKQLWEDKIALAWVLFFSLLPYFASLGTVVRFQLKATAFFPYLAVTILYLLNRQQDKRMMQIFAALSLYCVLVFFSFNFRTGWSNYNVLNQKVRYEISDKKGVVYLEQYRVDRLKELAPYLKNNPCVITSHENVWGYVYLLDSKPLYISFRFNPKFFYYFIKEHDVDQYAITFVELNRKPFAEGFKDFLNGQQTPAHQLEKIFLSEFTIYKYKKTSDK